jgi:hypothetical protein
MLKDEDKSLQFLGENQDPCPSLWNSTTDPLSADKEEDWTSLRVEVVIIDPVPLFPGGELSGIIVVVVSHLIEPILFLL